MQFSRAHQPVVAAAVSLFIFGASILLMVMPTHRALSSVPMTVMLSLIIAVSAILHLVFIGIAARRLGRSAALWVVLALFTLPVGSIVGLILFEWFSDEKNRVPLSG